ncbi:hypothetical protein DFO70_13117 [Cytobacillus firmus]|uniref:Thioredoxin n=2 Tax=Cytobacillus TaxID=2675230 RepID=A0A366JHA5_CYTFI|nr:hypothetical protein DFO70_13117 [Cytobacillus firmus]TDX36403.1 hypothetical protein DFO72_12020 [Cytobacillus oceanisediminis]
MAKTITAEEYQELATSINKPIVLEFGADW